MMDTAVIQSPEYNNLVSTTTRIKHRITITKIYSVARWCKFVLNKLCIVMCSGILLSL